MVKELFTFNDGRKYMGVFRDNKPWGITYCDKDGKIIGIGCEWSIPETKPIKTTPSPPETKPH